MSKVIVLRGIPGSGKSTYAKEQIAREAPSSYAVCSADNFFVGTDGVYRFDATKLGEAHAACLRDFYRAIDLGLQLVVVDNTNVRAWESAAYIQLARLRGYEVEVVRFHGDPATIGARNVHGCPPAAIERMYKSMERLPSALGDETVINVRA